MCGQKQIMLVTDYSNDTAEIGLCSKCLMKPAILTDELKGMALSVVRTYFEEQKKSWRCVLPCPPH